MLSSVHIIFELKQQQEKHCKTHPNDGKKRVNISQVVRLTLVGCSCVLAGSWQGITQLEIKVLRQAEQMQAAHDLHEPL